MPDRTEANPNELNQDDARYGFSCCHLKNIWTAPLPPETELSRQMTSSTTSIFFFQAEDGIRAADVTGVQTCALPISGLVALQALHLAALVADLGRHALQHAAAAGLLLGQPVALRLAFGLDIRQFPGLLERNSVV